MMESAENGMDSNSAADLDRARVRRILAQGQVDSALIVIGLVGAQQIPQMAFAKDDNVVETFASDRAYEPFRMSILPG